MVEGNNEEMSTSELFGGARIHYIFQSIFVRSLEVYLYNSLSFLYTQFYLKFLKIIIINNIDK